MWGGDGIDDAVVHVHGGEWGYDEPPGLPVDECADGDDRGRGREQRDADAAGLDAAANDDCTRHWAHIARSIAGATQTR